jgi:hypothetical protein
VTPVSVWLGSTGEIMQVTSVAATTWTVNRGVSGSITGRAYAFSGAEPLQEVDVRDAAILARSDRFRGSAP